MLISVRLERKVKEIPSDIALKISKLLHIFLKRSRIPTKSETESGNNSLDGSVISFYSESGLCGMSMLTYKGNPEILLV